MILRVVKGEFKELAVGPRVKEKNHGNGMELKA